MKYILILLMFFALAGNAQDRVRLNVYGIDISFDAIGLELYKIDSTLSAADAQKVVRVEFEGFQKLTVIWLKKGKLATNELRATSNTVKQKKLKIAYQETNAIIVEQKGTYSVFYATTISGNQFFIQSNICSTLEKAKGLLAIAKSIQ